MDNSFSICNIYNSFTFLLCRLHKQAFAFYFVFFRCELIIADCRFSVNYPSGEFTAGKSPVPSAAVRRKDLRTFYGRAEGYYRWRGGFMVKIGTGPADVETRRETFPKELRGIMSDSVLKVSLSPNKKKSNI